MANVILGISSRVKHPEYGFGVVINFKLDVYAITFVQIGTKNIKIDDNIISHTEYFIFFKN